jgi:uncharacterized tellurite resistance protein B-like protein
MSETKTSEEKRVYMLLKSVIFYYHGLDDLEKQDLDRTSEELDAADEYKWALEYISEDYVTAFERARDYLNHIIADYPKEKRIDLINMVWKANNLKGYVTEMEATAMLKLAKDWNVQKELIELVLQ